MKLADILTPEKVPTNSFFAHFHDPLRKEIFAITPDLSTNQMQRNPQDGIIYRVDGDFFETAYIPIITNTRLEPADLPISSNYTLPNDKKLKSKLGLAEGQILSLVYGDTAHRLVITGKKGWGKSTLLRFITAYAIPKINRINQNKICAALYISFNTKQVNVDDFSKEEFDKILLNNIRKFCAKERSEDISSKFYQYLLNKEAFSKEKEEYEDILEESKLDIIDSVETKQKCFQLRKKLLTQNDELVSLTCLEYFYYDTESSIIPLLILDDLDPFTTDIQIHAYKKIYELAHDYKIKTILAMRPRSYESVVRDTLDSIPANTVIALDKPDFNKYLLSKLSRIEKRSKTGVTVSNNAYFTVEKMKNFFSYYVDVLTQKDALSFLVNLSDGDLRIFNRLLETFLSSGYIKESEIIDKISKITQLRKKKPQEADSLKKDEQLFPMWVVFTSVITNNYVTVFRLNNDPFNHLMNVLCNGKMETNTHLIRLHILSHFIRLNTTHATIIEIYKGYTKLNGEWDNEDLLKSIRRAVGRFARARLIGNNKRILLEGMVIRNTDKYDEESFYLEELGKYYYTDLLNIYEYFLYMKDDVELEDNEFGIKDCVKTQYRYEKFEEVVKYVKFLFGKEKEFLKGVLIQKEKGFYEKQYAPLSGEIMYSLLFTKRLIKYADSREKILERRKKLFSDIQTDDSEAHTNENIEKLKKVVTSLNELSNEIESYIVSKWSYIQAVNE